MNIVASFFAGVGGIDLAFEQAGYKIVYANEIDKLAAKTYEFNFNLKVDIRDIQSINPKELPDFNVLVAGFPCQAFSIAGYRQGFNDEKGRGNLFFNILNILKIKKPEIVFLENVKNLVAHDKGNTFKVIREELEKIGYKIKYEVLNSMEYGNIPQNRERIYIVGFLNTTEYNNFNFPSKIELTTRIQDIIDYHYDVNQKYYYTKTSCGFYDKLEHNINRHDTVYQWRRVYVRENQNNVCPTLTANMGMGGHNVPLIYTNNKQYRKLTPQECFKLQGFPKEYILPKDTADSHLYKQAGNSIVVPVVKRIAENIIQAQNKSNA